LTGTGLACWLLPDLMSLADTLRGAEPSLERLLGQVAALVAAGCAGWWWAVTTAVTALAATGRGATPVPACPVTWRRLVLAACGVAVVSGLAVPVQAAPGQPAGDRHERSRGAAVVVGLPLPDRPLGLVRLSVPAPVPDDDAVVVTAGDTLWSIAEDALPPGSSDRQVGLAWRAIHADNRAVIGHDPDLIRPGQRLRVPTLGGRP